jgi:hypothetical protein
MASTSMEIASACVGKNGIAGVPRGTDISVSAVMTPAPFGVGVAQGD